MLLYVEREQLRDSHTQNIINSFPQAKILEIDNYKNIFDTPLLGNIEKVYVIAGVNTAIIQAPIFYGYSGKGFFLKNSLNCVYNCKYCYLQGIFKNEINVFFVNYRHIKKQIKEVLLENKRNDTVWFYSSDYSDNLATDHITNFTHEFIPFFAGLNGAKMEVRTKSTNISRILELSPTKNVEIAFSLSPQEIIDAYETGTPNLDKRVEAINKLLKADWQVGIRFMPLIACENYQEVYLNFLKHVIDTIDLEGVYSIFIGGLLFTEGDYKNIFKKQKDMDILYKMKKEEDGFYRQERDIRDWFYKNFSEMLGEKKVNVCFDY